MKRLLLVIVLALAAPAAAAAKPAPLSWCGTDEVAQNRVPDLEVSSARQVRVVYAIPSDGEDHFLDSASAIASDVDWIDEWWQAQDATRMPRFDRFPFPGCTPGFGQLDIGFIRLPNPAAYYSTPETPSIRLDDDLTRDFPAAQKTIVYYDGPIRSTTVCGETDYLANDEGGDNGIVYVYARSGCPLTPLGSGGSAEVAAHELLHNLGAVPDGAPNECPTSSGHVCDSESDIMYPFLSRTSTLDTVTLDVGRDDYYGHAAPQWDVQDSGWLEHLPQWTFSLAVAGAGTVAAATDSDELPCSGGCTGLALDNDTSVAMTAIPKPGWVFTGWSGGCSGTTPDCTVAVSADSSSTAAFTKAKAVPTVSVSGKGRVRSVPAGISCPGVCKASFVAAPVRLTAQAAAGWRFAGWTGACRGTRACSIRGAAAVRARFAKR